MTVYALTGNDVVIINDIPVNDFADNDIGTLDVPNDLFSLSTGKNNNTIFALNEQGNNATLTLRVLLSSGDDKRFNGLIPRSKDFASTILATGSVVKQVGDGSGHISYVTYLLNGGMIQRVPKTKVNVAGDTEQAVAEYVFQFAKVTRSIV